MRERFEKLPGTSVVFRLVTADDRFWPEGQSFPNALAFQPSSGDKAEGNERGHVTLVSVFDHDLTTVDEGKAFRQGKDCRPAWIGVSELCAIDVVRLRVEADPLPADRGAGGDGHCGIAGLDARADESGKRAPNKEKYMAMLDRVAQACQSAPPRPSARGR